MTRHFVLMTDELTPAEQKGLVGRLGRCGWWHNLPNAWLIVDVADNLTADAIRQMVQDVNDSKHCLALQVDPSDWSMRHSSHDLANSREWMLKYWLGPDS